MLSYWQMFYNFLSFDVSVSQTLFYASINWSTLNLLSKVFPWQQSTDFWIQKQRLLRSNDNFELSKVNKRCCCSVKNVKRLKIFEIPIRDIPQKTVREPLSSANTSEAYRDFLIKLKRETNSIAFVIPVDDWKFLIRLNVSVDLLLLSIWLPWKCLTKLK